MSTRSALLQANQATHSEQAYQCGLAVQFALLEDCLRQTPAGTALADQFQRHFAALESLNAETFVTQGTPFFWMNICRAIDQLNRATADLNAVNRHVLMTAFDSYFEYLPVGTSWTFSEGTTLVLPRLGIRVLQSESFTELRRMGDRTLVCSSPQSSIWIDLDQIPAAFQLPMVEVSDSARLLLSNDVALFEQDYRAEIAPDLPNAIAHAAMIGKSLKLIQAVNPEVAAAIAQQIHWYVPLHTPEVGVVHNSHTSSNLNGVIFLSEASNEIDLAEAIIHEFCHTELFRLMDTQDVIQERLGEKFYSPWRHDPRPLYGLFHALYVFAEVANFYAQAEAVCSDLTPLRERRAEIYYQVKLGLAQVPSNRLAAIGQRLVDAIAADLQQHETDLNLSAQRLPDWIEGHLETWHREHPQYCVQG
jgi:HEXXH motif-containing protein